MLHKTTNRERLGLRDGDKGTHTGRTLMLGDLRTLLAATPSEASVPDFRRAVVEENVLGKRAAITREHSVRKLKALYGLDPALAVYRILRQIWPIDVDGQPLLALLCAVARDPLLRASTPAVLDTPIGAEVTLDALAASVRPSFSASTRDALLSHLFSTWSIAGFLTDSAPRLRLHPHATPGAAAYALALGYMEGHRGRLLLSTAWTRLLDCSATELLALVQHASAFGWLDYRAAGDIMDLRIDGLFTQDEKDWRDGESS